MKAFTQARTQLLVIRSTEHRNQLPWVGQVTLAFARRKGKATNTNFTIATHEKTMSSVQKKLQRHKYGKHGNILAKLSTISSVKMMN